VQVQTPHFELRSMTLDAINEDYISWWNDAEIQRQLGSQPRGWTIEHARRHVSQFDNLNSFHLGIYTRDGNRLIGFTTILANPKSRVSTSNRVLGRKGVSKELSAWTIPFVFEKLDMQKIKAEVRGPNASSIALCEYLGFQREGLLRQDIPGPNGTRLDVHVYGLLRDDWRSMCANRQAPWDTFSAA